MTTYRFRSPELRRLGYIFAGAAADVYTLPPRVESAVAAIERLAVEDGRVRALPDPLGGLDLVDDLVAAARNGTPYPDAKRLVQAEAERRSRDLYQNALAAAADRLEDALDTAITGTAEELVVEHLQPALAETMSAAARCANLLADHGLEPANLLDAPDEARAARGELDRIAARYQAIRNAAFTIATRMPAPGPCRTGAGEVRNIHEVAAGYKPGAVPWPTDTAERLCWFAAHDADVWVPTPADIDAEVAAQADAAKAKAKTAEAEPEPVVDPERVPA